MDHYIEIRILPDPEFPTTLLMNALYSKLHKVLVELRSTDIGISFPSYQAKQTDKNQYLGEKLRLHSSRTRLEELMKINWLIGMHDHVRVGAINEIPVDVEYAVFTRVQTQSSAERIRRRQMRRHRLTLEKVTKRIPNIIEKRLDLPFVNIKSQSTAQAFRLFIKLNPVHLSIIGEFNSYGLSKIATVPLF